MAQNRLLSVEKVEKKVAGKMAPLASSKLSGPGKMEEEREAGNSALALRNSLAELVRMVTGSWAQALPRGDSRSSVEVGMGIGNSARVPVDGCNPWEPLLPRLVGRCRCSACSEFGMIERQGPTSSSPSDHKKGNQSRRS